MDFLLFSQGPLYQILAKMGLSNKSLESNRRRIIVICLLAWLPLLLFSFLTQTRFREFIYDISTHTRLLISLALLLYAEVIANERFQIVIQQFVKCHIISAHDLPLYQKKILSALKLSRSTLVEILLIIFVITGGRYISNQVMPYNVLSWYAIKVNNSVNLTLSGYWYVFVSLPIFQFIMLRWYYRLLIWFRLLWQISRMKLQLNSLHPDRVGGIGFLINSVYGLETFLMAHSFLLAGIIFNAIFNSNAILWQFTHEIMTWLFILVSIPLMPLFFFMSQLAQTKRNGTNEYDVFANQYVTAFKNKWLIQKTDDQLLGSPDIQSLADLSNSYNVSAQMNLIPLERRTAVFILLFTSLPFLPLILTIIPFEKILTQVIGIIF